MLTDVLVGGAIATESVVIVSVINDRFQRSRDKMARITARYEALALAARRFRRKALLWANDEDSIRWLFILLGPH